MDPPTQATRGESASFGSLTQREFDWQHWAFARNFAVSGFSAEEAFLLSWQFAPAVLYDLDRLPPISQTSLTPYDRFADLFSYTHFSLYNWRLGWRRPYFTLAPDVVLKNADFIMVREDPRQPPKPLPDHTLHASVNTPRGRIGIYVSRESTTLPYREIYARAYLDQVRAAGRYDQREMNTILFELVMDRMFLGRGIDLNEFKTWFPQGYRPSVDKYDVHWVGGRIAESMQAVWQNYQQVVEQWSAGG